MSDKKFKIRVEGSFNEEHNLQGIVNVNPKINDNNLNIYLKLIFEACPRLYNAVLERLGILRPATSEEKENHIYVFKSNDENDNEHKLFKIRENLYKTLSQTFVSLLDSLFPDIVYINQCKEYQQHRTFEEPYTEEEKKTIEEVTNNIREHYEEICQGIMNEMVKETKEEASGITREENNFRDDPADGLA